MMSTTGQVVQGSLGQVVSKVRRAGLQASLLLAIAAGLSGCGGAFNNIPSVNVGDELVQTPLGAIHGQVYGGQGAIYQGQVYLMKASHSNYGAASISLLTAASNTFQDTSVLGTPSNPIYYVGTDSAGNFNITGDYSCTYNATNPEQSDLLYLVGLGGQTNFSFNALGTVVPGSNNPYIGEMAVLGQCPSNGTFAGHLSYIIMNEVSTVAAAYALAPFATNSYSVGSPSVSQAEVGMTHAFANANLLYDIQGSTPLHEGRSITANGTGTVPYLLVDTLANIIANCINTSNVGGGLATNKVATPDNTTCNTLWANTGGATTDTASALIYIAQHPTKNVATLYGLQGSSYEFFDRLTNPPNDFSVGVNYSSAAFSNAVDVAVDGVGNAWVTNSDGFLSYVAPGGSISQAITLPGASYVALDPSNNAWVSSNTINGPIYQISSSGATLNTYTNGLYGDINYPMGIALDGNGNTYVANSGGGTVLLKNFLLGQAGDVVRIHGTGTTATYSSYYQSLLGQVLNTIPSVSQVAVDSQGYMWLSGDTTSCAVLILLCTGENVQRVSGANPYYNLAVYPVPVLSLSPYVQSVTTGSTSCILLGLICNPTPSEQTNGIAIDASNNAFVAVAGTTDKLDWVSTSAVVKSFTGGGLSAPQGVAIDGAGNVFVANTGNASISEYVSQGTTKGFVSGSTGITGASNNSSAPASVLNKPFNLDIDESGDVWIANAAPNYGFVTEFIGLAAPTVRPLATAASTSKLASRP